MALDVSGSHTPSLLGGAGPEGEGGGVGTEGAAEGGVGGSGLRKREKNFYGAPPITSKRAGQQNSHLIHPGAVLCMVDLLPCVNFSREFLLRDRPESGRGLLLSPPPTPDSSGQQSSGGGVSSAEKSPAHPHQDHTHTSDESFYDAEEGPTLVEGAGQGAESAGAAEEEEEILVVGGSGLTEEEVKQVSGWIQCTLTSTNH